MQLLGAGLTLPCHHLHARIPEITLDSLVSRATTEEMRLRDRDESSELTDYFEIEIIFDLGQLRASQLQGHISGYVHPATHPTTTR
jgi:hypothetical protein